MLGLMLGTSTSSKNKKWRHLLVAPNVRYYFGQKRDTLNHYSFNGDRLVDVRHDSVTIYNSGHYLELDAIYSHFNVGNVKFPFGMYKSVRDRRLQGDLLALVRNTVMLGFWHATGVLRLRPVWPSAMPGSRNMIVTTAAPIMARVTASSSCPS